MRNAASIVAVIMLCCTGSLILATIKVAARYHPLVSAAVFGSGFALYWAVRKIRDSQTLRRLGAEGWQRAPIDQPWP